MLQIKLADRLKDLNESATLALNARAKQMVAEGKTVYNLTAGELAIDTPDYIQKAVAANLSHNKYTPVAGLPELRQQLASHVRDYYGLNWIQPANVVVSAATKPAMYAAMLALLNPGDEVIVPTPAWGSHIELVKIAGGKPVEVPLTDDYDLDVPAIEAKLTPKTKAVLINSPHNPTGSIFSESSLKRLAEALSKRDIYVIADDIYTQLVYANDFILVPKAGFEKVIIISGFSKSQALTGWRIGYLIAETEIAQAVTVILSHIAGNAPITGQYAAMAALQRQDKPPAGTVELLKRHYEIVVHELDNVPGLKHNSPGGAFYIFLDLRDLTDNSAQWCEALLTEAGVALVPGEAFMAPGFARLTFVTDEDTLRKALAAIKAFVERSAK